MPKTYDAREHIFSEKYILPCGVASVTCVLVL
jgi:hypothetical protein